jgi:flagellar hook-associated protein 2
MAGLTSSGLDVNTLVSQLVAAERAPLEQRISRAETANSTKSTAVNQLRTSLTSLQSALAGLKTNDALITKRGTSSDTAVFKATVTNTAVPASYAVEVTQLAAANRQASAEQAGGSTATVGSGDLVFTQNGNSFTVSVAAGTTLAGLRDAINSASGNTGVQAAILTTPTGSRLTLSSTKTGAANAISMTANNPVSGLDTFVSGFTTTVAAQDASVKIDGITVTSSGNTLSGTLDGVTLDLVAAKAGTTLNLTVSTDLSAIKGQINRFVNEYNAFQTQAARMRAYDPKTRIGGPLLGDASLRTIESTLRREISGKTSSVTGTYNMLGAIGIRFAADGKLSVNDTQLTAALNANLDEVAKMFTATDGFAARVDTVIKSQVDSNGALTQRTTSLDQAKTRLTKDREVMEARLLTIQKRYQAQFINLDKMLNEMQGTSTQIAKIGV